MTNKTYQLNIKDSILTLKTSSFKAERGSVLHTGIYNQELRAALTSGLVVLVTYLILRPTPLLVYYILMLIEFIAFFVLFMMFVFYEPLLSATIDKANSRITVSIKKFICKEASYPLSELKDIRQEHIVITPENPDGIRVVEKIALQHGTVIPGFGEVKEFYTVELCFEDGKTIIVFSSKDKAPAEALRKTVMDFINA
ncbi:MAG: hypothetical protein HY805_10835 [Nitrospirae bacterium]|nr:hypothetical protein [Nitrospirota bacterium]